MGNVSKYEGGSIIKSFRLPKLRFDEAKKGIEMYLKRFEDKKQLNTMSPLTLEEAFEDKVNVAELKFMQKKEYYEEKPTLVIDNKWPTGESPATKLEINMDIVAENKFLEKAKKMVVLDDEMGQYIKPSKKTIPSDLKEKLKELDPKIVVPEVRAYEKDGSIYYPCGCHLGLDKFYRNIPHCTLGYSKEHKEKYGI
jgi:hypothetical protein